jgi:hypothetical protein
MHGLGAQRSSLRGERHEQLQQEKTQPFRGRELHVILL